MPKLVDLCQSVNNSSDFDGAWYVQFAFTLQMDVKKAVQLYEKWGRGNIYAPGGFVMPDTPYMRRKLVANFGACVVVEANGNWFVRKPWHIGAKNRRKAVRADVVERGKISNDERKLMERKRLQSMFNDGKTIPQPKRGGKANSHSDIGKYVNERAKHIDCMEQSVVRFVQISVKH